MKRIKLLQIFDSKKDEGLLNYKTNYHTLELFKSDNNLEQYIKFICGEEIDYDSLEQLAIGEIYTRQEILMSLGVYSNTLRTTKFTSATSPTNPDSIYRDEHGEWAAFFMTKHIENIDPKKSVSRNYENTLSKDKMRAFYLRKPVPKLNEEIFVDIKNNILLFNEVQNNNQVRLFEFSGIYRIEALTDAGYILSNTKNEVDIIKDVLQELTYDLYTKSNEELGDTVEKYKEYLVASRGSEQAKLREKLLTKNKTAQFRSFIYETILIASHIVPWKDADHDQKIDVDNALLLDAITDRLFDRGHITFDQEGKLIKSKKLEESGDAELLEFLHKGKQIDMTESTKKYMEMHNNSIFIDSNSDKLNK